MQSAILLTHGLINDKLQVGWKGEIEPMNAANEPNFDDKKASPKESANPPKIVSAQILFEGQREICIELDGVVYRLRITRRNKLILQK